MGLLPGGLTQCYNRGGRGGRGALNRDFTVCNAYMHPLAYYGRALTARLGKKRGDWEEGKIEASGLFPLFPSFPALPFSLPSAPGPV